MAIAPLGSNALNGIQRGMQGLRRSAAKVAQSNAGNEAGGNDFARSMVEMKQHAVQVTASTRALKTYNSTMGTLLDIKA